MPDLKKRRTHVETEGGLSYSHRLHYRWSQLEADRCGLNLGSPGRPLPRAVRTVELHQGIECKPCQPHSSESPAEQARFSLCAGVYKTFDYNTFCKNGCLKLTEIELFFLSSMMTRKSSGDWAVVYLGVGNGERFRYLRDEFFPGLSVIAFDPIDSFYSGVREDVEKRAKSWNRDGTNFTFHVRAFDPQEDIAWIKTKLESRRLLLISDIRGIALHEDGTFNKGYDNDLQWQAIKALQPISSLVKFAFPEPWEQFYDYAPGVILKQVYVYYGSREVRLLIDGVPEITRRYNAWDLYEQIDFHHEHLRGQVYQSSRRCIACLDFSFDSTVLWDTVSAYADKNHMDPYDVLRSVVTNHIYTPSWEQPEGDAEVPGDAEVQSWKRRWWDVEWHLKQGRLMEALAALEAGGDQEEEDKLDWANIADAISTEQPELAQRLRSSLQKPASRAALLRVLGSLSEPFTLLRTHLNCLLDASA